MLTILFFVLMIPYHFPLKNYTKSDKLINCLVECKSLYDYIVGFCEEPKEQICDLRLDPLKQGNN